MQEENLQSAAKNLTHGGNFFSRWRKFCWLKQILLKILPEEFPKPIYKTMNRFLLAFHLSKSQCAIINFKSWGKLQEDYIERCCE